VVLISDYGAVRIFNGTNSQRNVALAAFNAVPTGGYAAGWRLDFRGQNRVLHVAPDSMSGYLLFGFTYFKKGMSGQYQVGVRSEWENFGGVITDSMSVEPFSKDHRYSAIVYGPGPGFFSMKILWDTTASPPAGMAAVRFFNGESDAAAIASLAEQTHGQMAQAVGSGGESPAVMLPAGSVDFVLGDDTGGGATLSATLKSGQTYTAIAVGSKTSNNLRIVLTEK
jgi:hypothetical protein